jgi:hypothetical protein
MHPFLSPLVSIIWFWNSFWNFLDGLFGSFWNFLGGLFGWHKIGQSFHLGNLAK